MRECHVVMMSVEKIGEYFKGGDKQKEELRRKGASVHSLRRFFNKIRFL